MVAFRFSSYVAALVATFCMAMGSAAWAQDVTPPRITSIERLAPTTNPTNADSVIWRVTFDEPMQAVGADMFSVTGSSGALSVTNNSNTQTDVTLSGGDMMDLDATVTLTANTATRLAHAASVDGGDNPSLGLLTVASLTPTTLGDTTYLYYASLAGTGGGFSVNPATGALTHAALAPSDDVLRTVATATLGGTTYLYTGGGPASGINAFSIDPATGALTFVGSNNGNWNPGSRYSGVRSITTATLGATTYLFAASHVETGTQLLESFVNVFSVNPATGALTQVENINNIDNPEFNLSAVRSVTTATMGGTTYLFTAGYSTIHTAPFIGGVSVFSVNPATGALTHVASVDDSDDPAFELEGATSVTTATIGARTYLFVAGFQDNGVSVFSVNPATGALTHHSYADDSFDPALQLGGARAVTTATVGDTTYLFVAGSQDDGVSVFSFRRPALDLAGNGLGEASPTGTNNNSFTIDNTPPTLAITGPSGPVAGGNFSVTFTFSEDVTGFSSSDISIGNGTLAALIHPGAGVSVAIITPTADGAVTIDVAAGAAADAAGNASTAAAQFSVTHDATAPTVAIAGPAGPVSAAFAATFTFSENVTGFALDDITVGNGVASNFQATSGSVYNATITPTADGAVTIDVAAGAAADAAGNASTAAAQFSVTKITLHTLTVGNSGVGVGTIVSAPAGIDCGATCAAQFESGTDITLTAAAGAESRFSRWTSGPCADSVVATCEVTLNADQTVEARFVSENLPDGRIVAAALPGARSSYIGGPTLTVFFSVVSRVTTPAQGCRIAAANDPPFTFSYRAVDAGNAATGPINPFFDIQAGGIESFVLIMEPTATTGGEGYTFLPQVVCENATLTPVDGISSVFLSISATPPVPDLLAIGTTVSNDGVVRIPATGNRVSFMAASAINIGAGDGSAGANQATITASVDTGATSLPATLEVCESGPTGCITPRGQTTTTTLYDPNVAKTYTVFVRANGSETIPFSPANARVFLRFRDAGGVLRSVTSAAISAPAPDSEQPQAAALTGRWSVLIRQDVGDWPVLRRASVFLGQDDMALIDDGISPRLVAFEAGEVSTDIVRFELGGLEGVATPDGRIAVSDALVPITGAFLGVRDTRSDTPVSLHELAGSYGLNDSSYGQAITVSASGSISGTLAGCIVSGNTTASGGTGPGYGAVNLMGCSQSGIYAAAFDTPANDNTPIALLIANGERGWRVEGGR